MSKVPALAAVLLVLIILATACAPGGGSVPLPPPGPAGKATLAIPAPTQAVQPTASIGTTSGAGFVLFDKPAGMLRSYNLDGSLRFASPAPQLEYPYAFVISVLKDAVYYASEGADKTIYRASASGAQKLDLSIGKLSAFTVSPDEKWIAWSTFNGETNPPSSELWIKPLDGQGGKLDAKRIASASANGPAAFALIPLQWAADNSGRLYFERSLAGLGGYILYLNHLSLFGYDTATETFTTYVAPDENGRMCLDAFRLDLNKVTFTCGKDGSQVTIRDLQSGQEAALPNLPEQGTAGSSQFSPSGKWLAYAVARSNPDDEAGQVAVVPTDLSAAPQVIYKVSQQRYMIVQGWLDEDTLLVTVASMSDPANRVLTIKRDGTDAREIASGQFIGWTR